MSVIVPTKFLENVTAETEERIKELEIQRSTVNRFTEVVNDLGDELQIAAIRTNQLARAMNRYIPIDGCTVYPENCMV